MSQRWRCERGEGEQPVAAAAEVVVESLAQLLQSALQAAVHGGHWYLLLRRDAPRRQAVEEAQQHRRSIGLVELQHGSDESLLRLGALHEDFRGVARAVCAVRLAAAASPFAAAMGVQEVLQYGRQPRAPLPRWCRLLQSDGTGILHDVLGEVWVVGQPVG
ncbi:MAG: hypothetical protein ABIP94_17650 [Planctomycetota bacterium]